ATHTLIGKMYDLMIPIALLMVISLLGMLVTGVRSGGSWHLVSIFEHASVSASLVAGASIGLIYTLLRFPKVIQTARKTQLRKALTRGLHTTLPAVWILLLAWTVATFTDWLGTGLYLSELIGNWQIAPQWMPLALFVLTGVMSFSTGTSWGTFAIMLPIAAQLAVSMDIDAMHVYFASVLAGSLFGDPCSPISDTTTVAASAAGCAQLDHFRTQLPYALTTASMTAIGFFVYGLSEQLMLCYVVLILLILCNVYYHVQRNRVKKRTTE
ncbi:MAG: Na+/H+ antiporter NhaC family protein, partial [Bacilli bacterium]